jgi:lipopolysaccharide/colanic/teichoic acid biosynthesis glycosyltransferase
VALGAPSDLPRALLHPAVVGGRFSVVESIALDIEDADGALAGLAEAAQLVRDGRVDALLVAGQIGPTNMRRVADVALAFHCEVLAVMPTEVLAEHEPVVVWTDEGPLIQLARLPRHPFHDAVKRCIDVVLSAIGLIVAAPLLIVLGLLVMIESPGTPIFKHTRIGFRGRKFSCLKLRTMRADAEAVLRADRAMYEEYRQNHFKIPESRDPRVTKLGRFLRQTSLDELPQLWNVLVGDMSLVGPRPVVEEELAMYGEDRDLMLSVKPGLTGAWAANGRQSVGYPERCELELGYVRDRTLLLDAQIIARTAGIVLRLYGDPP